VVAAAAAPAAARVLAAADRARALVGSAALVAGGVLAGVAALPAARTLGQNGHRR
jgi:hypothetical protein